MLGLCLDSTVIRQFHLLFLLLFVVFILTYTPFKSPVVKYHHQLCSLAPFHVFLPLVHSYRRFIIEIQIIYKIEQIINSDYCMAAFCTNSITGKIIWYSNLRGTMRLNLTFDLLYSIFFDFFADDFFLAKQALQKNWMKRRANVKQIRKARQRFGQDC